MDEKKIVVGYLDDHYVMLDDSGTVVTVLAPGMRFEIWMGGEWQAVRLESGGYRGCYYVTSGGERGRLALCMRARLCEADAAPGEQEEVPLPLEQLRLVWVGKQARNRVPLAGGYVCGEVRQVTDRGLVLFVYTPPLNPVCVRARFPVERLFEVLALAS